MPDREPGDRESIPPADAPPLPLSGIRVLELGSLIAGPFAGRMLADFGAEVIKVEPPGAGDQLRGWGAVTEGGSLWFAIQARNKRSVTIDLRRPDGQALARRLAEKSDVVLENFRPGTLERWGLGWEELRAVNPRLVMVRISGFGQTGPYRHRPGFGNIAEAMGGIRYVTGYPDRPPVRVNLSLGDHIAALHAVVGALTALQARTLTGRGQVVDVALTESVFNLLEAALPEYVSLGQVRERAGNGLLQTAPSNIYQTADGVWMAISGNSDSVFVRLMRAIGREDLARAPELRSNAGRVAHAGMLDEAIGAWAAARTAEAVAAVLEAAEVPFGPVYSIADIARDPQYRARGMILDVSHPRLGRVAMPGITPVLAETPGTVRWPGPGLGADTDAVLRELAGLSAVEIARLRADGVV